MMLDYLKTSGRNLRRNKIYSLINIIGLGIGMAGFILIFLWARHELSYDRFHEQADRIHRVGIYSNFGGNEFYSAKTPAPLSSALRTEYPQILHSARLVKKRRSVRLDDSRHDEKYFYYADPSLFDVFTIPFLRGDPRYALDSPRDMVITEAAARKYFDREDPLGRILTINDEEPYLITGVVRALPGHSHFHFDFLASLASLENIDIDNWDESFLYTYFVLRYGASAERLEAEFPRMVEKYIGPDIQRAFGMSLKEWSEKSGNSFRYFTQRLKDIHLRSNLEGEIEANGDIEYVAVFSLIGIAVLLIAGINFVNLTTARSCHRARNVGIRKILGSDRPRLVARFITDSLVLSFLAFAAGLALSCAFLPFINDLSNKNLHLNIFRQPELIGVLGGLIVLVGIAAGGFPAFYFASLSPMGTLRGRTHPGSGRPRARKALVLFQFTITTTLLICSVVIHQQLSFMKNKKLGFRKEQVIVIPHAEALGTGIDAFKRKLERNSRIVRASSTSSVPGEDFDGHTVTRDGPRPEERQFLAYLLADDDFFATYDLELKDGRVFAPEFSSDQRSVLLNEAAVKALGFEHPIGKRIGTVTPNRTVVGIVRDFHFSSVREKIGPLAIYRTDGEWNYISVRIQPGNIPASLDFIGTTWKEFARNQPFDFYFLDEKINGLYIFERNIGRLSAVFTLLAVTVACLGLLGLASFAAERSAREIGIRKILGASVLRIVAAQTRQFTQWVVAANAAAWPMAFYLMHAWLRNYPYRVGLQAWIFPASAALTLILSLVTVGYFSVKSALVNPVQSLNRE